MKPAAKARMMIEMTKGAIACPPAMTEGMAGMIKRMWAKAPMAVPTQMV